MSTVAVEPWRGLARTEPRVWTRLSSSVRRRCPTLHCSSSLQLHHGMNKRRRSGSDDSPDERNGSNGGGSGGATFLSPKSAGKRRATSPPSAPAPHRLILAIDIDCFYVSATRLLDSTLVSQPVGVKQKGLLATCSYEARALGVRKLSTVRDALRRCPDLILVDGEDLTWYRRLSKRCWGLVRGIVWGGKVEKLGLDELFCDVTEMVDAHIRRHEGEAQPSSPGRAFFQVAPQTDPEAGFWYDFDGPPSGHVLPNQTASDASSSSAYRQRLILASHLAQYIRERIHATLGLTTSAGVAHNKVLAKLVSSRHKPEDQTVFLPRDADDVVRFLDGEDEGQENDVRAIMGFGGSIVAKLRESLAGGGGETPAAGGGPPPDPPPLTVSLARKAFSLTHLCELFGPRLGAKLYALLRGVDDEEVTPTPLYPAQISIEDTYRSLRGHNAVAEQVRTLSESLLRRIEAELMATNGQENELESEVLQWVRHDEPLALPGEQGTVTGREPPIVESGGKPVLVRCYRERNNKTAPTSSTWQRYPLTVRLTVRHGWSRRTSRSTAMPLDVFDVATLSRRERAERLAVVLMALLRGSGQAQGQGDVISAAAAEGLNLINIAAVNLAAKRPAAQSLKSFFDGSGAVRGRTKSGGEAVDMETLLQLPEDIRREVAAQYGIVLPQEEATAAAASDAENGIDGEDVLPLAAPLVAPSAPSPSSASLLVCSHCGVVQAPWLQHDHARWPIYGLPAALLDSASGSH